MSEDRRLPGTQLEGCSGQKELDLAQRVFIVTCLARTEANFIVSSALVLFWKKQMAVSKSEPRNKLTGVSIGDRGDHSPGEEQVKLLVQRQVPQRKAPVVLVWRLWSLLIIKLRL